jgi:hypothetical protein
VQFPVTSVLDPSAHSPAALIQERATSMKTRARVVLPGLLLLLAAAILLQLIPHPTRTATVRGAALTEYFPQKMFGWLGEDRALAETEATTGAVTKILRYDEALLRTYRRNGLEFSLYVAYWKPGKMSSREIAAHTPDTCWPAAGWKRTFANLHFIGLFGGTKLAPAQYREFESGSHHESMVYWHIVNGRPVVYNPDGVPSPLSMFHDLLEFGLDQMGEQYFIRVSSPNGIKMLWPDEGFQEIVELILPLGPGGAPTIKSKASAH